MSPGSFGPNISVRDCVGSANGNADFLIDAGQVRIDESLTTNNVTGIKIGADANLALYNVNALLNISNDIVNQGGYFFSYKNNRYSGGPEPTSITDPR